MHTEEIFTHSDLFGYLKDERFSEQDAAEYLEVSMPTFWRTIQSGKLIPAEIVGRSQRFSSADLRKFKKSVL